MRRAISQQMSFGDCFIDASLYALDEELEKVDELLSDAQLLRPFEEVFDPSLGRPGTAVGVYLRMMHLKFRWGLSTKRWSGKSESGCRGGIDVGIIDQAVRTLTRTAACLGQKITNHIRACKRAVFRWSQTAKAHPKERK